MNSPKRHSNTATKPSEKTSYHHGDLKAVLLDETARILRDEGEAALSLRRLAANVGVSRTAPYHHFKDKQGLLCAVAEEGFVRFNVAMDAALRKGRGLGGDGATLEYVKGYVNFAIKNPEYYDLMYGGKLWRSQSLTEALVSSARGTLRGNVQRIESLQVRVLLSADIDPLRYSQVIWGMLHGISRLLIDGIYVDSASSRKLCETAAEILWSQLDPS
ncbi:MAG: AcrR family transcriptional regulator [Halioglobus sp.]|jgi:AcrR family transcriptional regulator